MITGTSILSMNCNCGARDQAPVVAHQLACQQPCPGTRAESHGFLSNCNCGRRLSPPHLHLRICTTGTQGTSTTLSDCRLHNNGHVDDQPRTALSNTLSMNESEVPSTVNRRGLLELVVHGQRCPVFENRPGLAVYPGGEVHWVWVVPHLHH